MTHHSTMACSRNAAQAKPSPVVFQTSTPRLKTLVKLTKIRPDSQRSPRKPWDSRDLSLRPDALFLGEYAKEG
jgi:hypothetical protein